MSTGLITFCYNKFKFFILRACLMVLFRSDLGGMVERNSAGMVCLILAASVRLHSTRICLIVNWTSRMLYTWSDFLRSHQVARYKVMCPRRNTL